MKRKRQVRSRYYARRIDFLIASPKEALKAKDIRDDPEVCRRFLVVVDEQQNKNPKQALKFAAIGTRLAVVVDDACLRSRSFGALASTHRALGRVDKAGRSLEIARSLCACTTCTGDRLRRRAYLRVYQGRLTEALSDCEQAILSFEDEDGRGRARICKGEAYYHLGDIAKAISETSAGLKMISLPGSALFHRCAVYNIGAFIIHSENPSMEAVFFAARQLEKAKKLFHGLRGEVLSAERARFDWTLAILLWRLGQAGRRAQRLLTSARDRFVALAMKHEEALAQEAAAVTADLAWVTGCDRREIRRLLRTLSPLTPLFKEEILQALKALQDATRAKIDASEAIRTAIIKLREKATGPGIVPSMLMLLAGAPQDDPTPIGF